MTPTLDALATSLAARVPVILWGGPGTGKTSAISAMATRSELPVEVVIASIREPSDFGGLPVVDERSVRFAPPMWAERLAAEGRGVLFLDELSTAPPAVQAALLRVVLERHVGDLQLPEEVMVVAAANPPDQAADGWELAPPLANRFCHLDWSTDARTWAEGSLSGWPVPPIRPLAEGAVQAAASTHRARIGAFLVGRPGLLSKLPDDATTAGRAWPSPRSWTMASTLLGANDLLEGGPSLAAVLLAGCVGPGAALEYRAWVDEAGLIDPEEALRDPSSFRMPERGDRAYAALSSIVAAVRADATPERWVAAWHAIASAVGSGQVDLAVAVMRPLVELRPAGAIPPREALAIVAPVLREAGLLDRLAGPG
ncbi:MAG: ATP-binding protein [Acidimicrobiales bacterium]